MSESPCSSLVLALELNTVEPRFERKPVALVCAACALAGVDRPFVLCTLPVVLSKCAPSGRAGESGDGDAGTPTPSGGGPPYAVLHLANNANRSARTSS